MAKLESPQLGFVVYEEVGTCVINNIMIGPLCDKTKDYIKNKSELKAGDKVYISIANHDLIEVTVNEDLTKVENDTCSFGIACQGGTLMAFDVITKSGKKSEITEESHLKKNVF